jgi:hypothetical protein
VFFDGPSVCPEKAVSALCFKMAASIKLTKVNLIRERGRGIERCTPGNDPAASEWKSRFCITFKTFPIISARKCQKGIIIEQKLLQETRFLIGADFVIFPSLRFSALRQCKS